MNRELVGTHGILLLSASTDGNMFKVVLKTRACEETSASLWHADFLPSKDVGGCWRVTMLPYARFSPVLKNQPCDPGGALYPEAIEELGLMISRTAQDGSANPHITEGDFELNIKWIRGYFASLRPTESPLLSPPKSPLAGTRHSLVHQSQKDDEES